MSSRKRILVTNAVGDAGLGVVRELVSAGHDVVGADATILPLGLRSRFLKTVHRLLLPENSGFDEHLLALVRAVAPDVFLPLGSRSVEAACRQSAELGRLTAMVVPALEAFMAAFDHAACVAECAQLGIPCPAVFSERDALQQLVDGGGKLTLVVKPRTDVGFARGIAYVNEPDALQRSLAACIAEFGGAIIQEYIPGPATAMRSVLVLFDQHSQLIAAFTLRKLRQWPPTGGVTALGLSTADANLVDLVLPFFKKWRWRGFAEAELKVDERDGVAKVIEINPRNPGYLRFPITCGLPLGRLAVAAALDEATTTTQFPSYAVGKKFIKPELFLRSVAAELPTCPSKIDVLAQAGAELRGTGGFLAEMFADPWPPVGRFLLGLRQGRSTPIMPPR